MIENELGTAFLHEHRLDDVDGVLVARHHVDVPEMAMFVARFDQCLAVGKLPYANETRARDTLQLDLVD